MTELTINIPERKRAQVEQFISALGGKVKPAKVRQASKKRVKPSFLFGEWKSVDADLVQIRKKLWDRKSL